MTNHINARKKVSSGGRWTDIEKENLKNCIENGCLLSEIEHYLSNRSGDAILAQARAMGHGEQKLDNGDKSFIMGVKYRGSNKEKSIEVKSDQTGTSMDHADTVKYLTDIVPQKAKLIVKELRMLALDLLYEKDLIITDQSVKQTMSLLSKFKKEVSL